MICENQHRSHFPLGVGGTVAIEPIAIVPGLLYIKVDNQEEKITGCISIYQEVTHEICDMIKQNEAYVRDHQILNFTLTL